MEHKAPSPRTQIRRKPQRGHHDSATVAAIIDSALICQIAFNQGDSVHCLPTACWRVGNALYIHGANNSRLTRTLLDSDCSVCIAHVDGLVLARSAFHHSMNFRSVVIYGRFVAVDSPEEKKNALIAFVEHVSPGRSALARPPSDAELAGTAVLRLTLDEAAAKIRDWGVEDDACDLDIPVWAGVVPLRQVAGPAQADSSTMLYPQAKLPDWLNTST